MQSNICRTLFKATGTLWNVIPYCTVLSLVKDNEAREYKRTRQAEQNLRFLVRTSCTVTVVREKTRFFHSFTILCVVVGLVN